MQFVTRKLHAKKHQKRRGEILAVLAAREKLLSLDETALKRMME